MLSSSFAGSNSFPQNQPAKQDGEKDDRRKAISVQPILKKNGALPSQLVDVPNTFHVTLTPQLRGSVSV